jgi:hypothetical protein
MKVDRQTAHIFWGGPDNSVILSGVPEDPIHKADGRGILVHRAHSSAPTCGLCPSNDIDNARIAAILIVLSAFENHPVLPEDGVGCAGPWY